jgi:hypothetical protein
MSTLYTFNKQQFNADVSLNGTNTVTGKTQFNADVSFNSNTTFNNTSTQISSSGVVGISGGIVNISGGVINLNGTLNHSVGNIITNAIQSIYFTSPGDSRFTSPDTFTTYINNDKTGGDVRINTNTSGSNVIVENGKLGIGTSVFGGTNTKVNIVGTNPVLGLQSGWGYDSQVGLQAYNTGMALGNLSGNNLNNTLFVNNNGNVGIGTASPGQKLDVMGHIRSREATAYIFQETPSSDYGNLILRAGYSTNPTNAPHIRLYGWNGGSGNDNVITFSTNNVERMRVSSYTTLSNIGSGSNSTNDNNTSILHIIPFSAINSASNIAMFASFRDNQNDYTPRRAVDIYADFVGNGWGNERILFGLGRPNNGSNDGSVGTYVRATMQASGPTTASFNVTGDVKANGTALTSDRRIKTNIVDINDEQALHTLRLIKPKTYDYIDITERGKYNVIGFIAQEIQEIIPNAITLTTKFVPNFYTNCQITKTDASNILLVSSPIDLSWNPLHDACGNAFVDSQGNACSDASGNKVFNVRIQSKIDEYDCKTTSILDTKNFLIDISGSKFLDASGNCIIQDINLLYGQEVDDFHYLDKNAIFTVVTAAVQDIDRKQVLDEAKIAALESKNATLEAQVASLQSQMAAVLSKLGM